jgi:hypothetical protein
MTAAVVPIRPRGSLYEITDHLAALFDTVDMAETEEQRQAIGAEIANYLEAEVRKVDGVASYLAHCEAQQQLAAAEIQRLQNRKEAYERREEHLKQYVISIMEANKLKKLEGATSTLSLRACPASVEVLDEAAVPAEFMIVKQVVSLDRKAIKAALESDVDVPGVDLVIGKQTLVRR